MKTRRDCKRQTFQLTSSSRTGGIVISSHAILARFLSPPDRPLSNMLPISKHDAFNAYYVSPLDKYEARQLCRGKGAIYTLRNVFLNMLL